MENVELDTTDVSIFMSQPTDERQFAAASFVQNFMKCDPLTDAGRLYHKLLRMCLCDKDRDIQEDVANRLSHCQNLPSDIAVQIIVNKLEPADWLLEHYRGFKEQDLFIILLSGGCREYEQISRRTGLTPLIIDHICQNGCEKAVSILLENVSAPITVKGGRSLIERYSMDTGVMARFIGRQDLPEEILAELGMSAAGKLSGSENRANSSPSNDNSQHLKSQQEQELAHRLNTRWTLNKKREAIFQLVDDGRLTYSLLCRKLLDADTDFFAIALSIKSDIPESLIRAKIHEGDLTELRDIFRQSKVPSYLFPALKTVIKLLRNKGKLSENQRLQLQRRALDEIGHIYHLPRQEDPDTLLENLLPKIGVRKLN